MEMTFGYVMISNLVASVIDYFNPNSDSKRIRKTEQDLAGLHNEVKQGYNATVVNQNVTKV